MESISPARSGKTARAFSVVNQGSSQTSAPSRETDSTARVSSPATWSPAFFSRLRQAARRAALSWLPAMTSMGTPRRSQISVTASS